MLNHWAHHFNMFQKSLWGHDREIVDGRKTCEERKIKWTLSESSASMLSGSVMFDSLQPHALYPASLFCPWDYPSKNTVMGCHFLL